MLKKWWKTLFIDLTSDDDFDDVGEQDLLYKKQGGPENPKARRRTARLF